MTVGAVKAAFEDWQCTVPPSITTDPLWRMASYRLALFVSDVAWGDVSRLVQDRRTRDLSGQLYRALGSVGANIAEGYSRSSSRDQARFYEYALGSARESREWYFRSRHLLGEPLVGERMEVLSRISQLLLATIQRHRSDVVRDAPADPIEYGGWPAWTSPVASEAQCAGPSVRYARRRICVMKRQNVGRTSWPSEDAP